MNPLPSQLPRRHAQRQALRSTRNAALRSQVRGSRIRRNNKSGSNWDIDSVSDLDRDSGYNSHSNSETEARYYDQMMDKFEEEGPALSNPGDSTLVKMEIEKRNWQK